MSSLTNTARIYKDVTDTCDRTKIAVSGFIKYFDKFLEIKKMAMKTLLPTETLCSIDLINEFSGFLAETKQLSNGTDPLKMDSAGTIFSYCKGWIKKNAPQNTLEEKKIVEDFFGDDDFFTTTIAKMKEKIKRNCVYEGQPIVEKAPAIGRTVMKDICRACFRYRKE